VPTDTPTDTPPVDTPDPGRRAEPRLQETTTAFLRTAIPLLAVIIGLALFTGTRNGAFLTGEQPAEHPVSGRGARCARGGPDLPADRGQMDLSVGSLASLVGVLAAHQFAAGWSAVAVVAVALVTGAVIGLLWA